MTKGGNAGFRGGHGTYAVPGLPERGIRAFLLDELVVRAELGELAVLDDGDAVGVVRGLQPVRDRDDRPSFEHGGQRTLQMACGARVEEGRRLVEDERVRVGEHEPGERDLLLLGRRQREATGADHRLQPVRERLCPRPRVHRLERREQFLVGRSNARKPQVVGQRADEDVLLLRHQRDLAPQRLQVEIDEAHVTHLDPSRARRMDAREQAPQRRLPRPRRSDDGDPLAGLEVEVEAVQHVAPVDVGVTDVRRAQPLVLGLLARRLAIVRDLRHAHQAREGRRSDLDLVQPRDQAVDGVGEQLDVEGDRGHVTDRGPAGGDEPAAPDERRGHRQHVGDLDRRETRRCAGRASAARRGRRRRDRRRSARSCAGRG